MFDGFFELISGLLNFFYELVPNYAVAIALLTCTVMLITTPLTLKGTRSMIEMQRLQPELRRLQAQYKDDRQKLNEEMMKFYREHEINPVGGCLPLLVQMPVFGILFWVVRGLTNRTDFVGVQNAVAELDLATSPRAGFDPKYLDHSSELYTSLVGQDEMVSFGVDLAVSPWDALGDNFITALPYLLLVVVIGGLAWYQQKQIMGRNKASEVTQQQRMMMRLGPTMQVFFTFLWPAALGVYFLVSTAWRVAQQTYITHSMYKGEDSVGVQAQRAMAQARAEKANPDRAKSGGNGAGGSSGGPDGGVKATSGSRNGATTGSSKRGQSSRAASAGAPSGGSRQAKPHPRSRKKKKRK
jgi:YidC/Oxa1 family membrane protein insertase